MKNALIIIAFLAGVLVAYNAGFHTAHDKARQECIDKVTENCDYICGVGAEFYYPDQQSPSWSDEQWELVDDSMIALKGDYAKFTQTR
jgi:hypothetical protein